MSNRDSNPPGYRSIGLPSRTVSTIPSSISLFHSRAKPLLLHPKPSFSNKAFAWNQAVSLHILPGWNGKMLFSRNPKNPLFLQLAKKESLPRGYGRLSDFSLARRIATANSTRAFHSPLQPDLPDIHTEDCRQIFFPVPKQKPPAPRGKRVTDNNTS